MLRKLRDRSGRGRVPDSVFGVGAVLAIAFFARIIYALIAGRIDPILQVSPLYGDASGYHLLAVNLLKGWGLSWDGQALTSFRMPGYPIFLAAIYRLAAPNPIYVRTLQAFLGAAACLPVMAIARRLAGDLASLLAGLGLALHPILIYMVGWVYSETLFILLLWSGLWLLMSAIEEGPKWIAVVSGFVLGLATTVRPEIFAFPAFVAALALILLRWHRRRLSALLLAQAGIVLVILPWTARNIAVHGSFVPLTTNTGVVLYGGNNPEASGGFYLDVPFVLPGYTEAASNQELTRRALSWAVKHPADYLQLLPQKVYKFFSPVEMEHSGSPLGAAALPVNLIYLLFLLFAAWGGMVSWRKNPTIAALIISLVVWYVVIAVILYGGTRVALPIAPALILLAASGLSEIIGRRMVRRSLDPAEAA